MVYLLKLPDGRLVPCRDAAQALALARLYIAITTGAPAR